MLLLLLLLLLHGACRSRQVLDGDADRGVIETARQTQGPREGSPSLGELLAQGKDNLQAPWLGLTAFFVIAIMLSLLIFIGEAVRDALDPRKTLA